MFPLLHPQRKPNPIDAAREAVRLRLQGMTYKDIGRRLGISIYTARNYVKSLGMFRKQPYIILGDDGKFYPSRYCKG